MMSAFMPKQQQQQQQRKRERTRTAKPSLLFFIVWVLCKITVKTRHYALLRRKMP